GTVSKPIAPAYRGEGHSTPAARDMANGTSWPSILFLPIEEDDARRVADGDVLAGEGERAGLAIHPKHRDVVAALVATVEELTGGVEVEAPRVASACPLLRDILQVAHRAH